MSPKTLNGGMITLVQWAQVWSGAGRSKIGFCIIVRSCGLDFSLKAIKTPVCNVELVVILI